MNKDYLINLIYEYNPHHRSGAISTPSFRRELYGDIQRWLPKKQAIAIVGLRRTGKTTLMLQLMSEIGRGASLFSFDEEETQNKESLVFVIDYMVANFGSKYIFLDEVHYVNDWEGVLKRYYDTKSLKFIISGSESLDISKAKAALAGRMVTFTLSPLNFREYLALKGERMERETNGTTRATNEFNEAWKSSVLPQAFEKFYKTHSTEKEFFERQFTEYLYNGAFPELANEASEETVRRYTQELVIRKVIFRDIPAIFDIKRKDLLFELFNYACSNSSNLFEIKSLSNMFKANSDTVASYLFYLQAAFLIKIAETYTKSRAKRIRRNKKIYVAHPAIAFAVLGMGKDALVEKVLGQYVEGVFAGRFFWRDKQKNEVDVVIDGQPPIPVEIKYRNYVENSELKGLLKFMDKHNAGRGIVITKNTFKDADINGKSVLFVPAWVFMLVQDGCQ